jgi:hypothetical protein
MSKPKRSPTIGAGQSISAQDRAGQTSSYNKAQGTLDQFEGPVQSSPFYKALERTGVESTSNAYQGARANMRARANASGMGGANQPIEAGAEASMDRSEASSLADVPRKAAIEAAPLSLQAAGQSAGMGTALGSQGADYFKSVIPLEEQYQDQLFKQQQAMWNALAQLPQDLMPMTKL